MQSLLTKSNLYKLLFFLIVLTMPFGDYLIRIDIGFMTLSAFRITLFGSVFILAVNRDLVFNGGRFGKLLAIIFAGWIAYALLSGLWVIDFIYYIKDVFHLLTGFCIFLTLQSFFYKVERPLQTFFNAWMTGFITQAIFAMEEMYSGKHLGGNFQEMLKTLPAGHLVNWVPVTTFDNPNNFSIYLVISGIFIAILMRIRPKYTIFLAALLTFCVLATYVGLSRFGMMAIAATWAAYALVVYRIDFFRETFLSRRFAVSVAIVALLIAYMFHFNDRKLIDLSDKPQSVAVELNKDASRNAELLKSLITVIETPNSSNNVRLNLVKNGWDLFLKSYGMGVGAGNFDAYMKRGLGKHETHNIINPHNWLIQVLSQYGILVLVPLLSCLAWVFVFYWKMRNAIDAGRPEFNFVIAGVLLVVAYAVLSNSGSSFMSNGFNWLMIAAVVIGADQLDRLKPAHEA